MKQLITLIIMILCLFILPVSLWSGLIENSDGTLVYDSTNDVTWIKDANYAKTSGQDTDGYMEYDDAVSWVNSLTYGGGTSWRLPTNSESTAPIFAAEGEMGKLYYTELGNIKDGINFNPCSPTGEVCFENIQRYGYWTSTTGFSGGDYIVTFRWSNGATDEVPDDSARAVWPVHDGALFEEAQGDTWQGEAMTWQGESVTW
jgi:hypothetical protein